MTHESSVNFKVVHFLLGTKRSHQNPNFDTFKCSSENLPNFPFHFSNRKSIFLQILHHSSVSWKLTPLYFLLYTLVTRSQLKHKFFRLLSDRVKICYIPHVNFKTASQFLFSFCIIILCHDTQILFKFQAHTFSTLD